MDAAEHKAMPIIFPAPKINEAQAQLLLDWMALAAEEGAADETQCETWRLNRFKKQAKLRAWWIASN